ncbi:MAG: hypothetical protein JJLCMIEE_01719 [Acidimicrobiales bacterium]|nr:MAG: peptidoglycan-binding protein [Actinomycetota bacterium]MBV6508654.1 hypothetical protein [Acidimicrobiales bacterium]RIK08098.1 MAG: hypothetical protein DCC48_01555 [Acidobacteriota bacterium]
MTSRIVRSSAVMLFAVLLAAACSSDDSSPTTTTTEETTTSTTEESTTSSTVEDLQECGDLSKDTVETIQQDLETLGYYDGEIDGECGDETESALIAFQEAEGLTADGKWGPNTEAAMERALSGGGGGSSTSTTGGGGTPACTEQEFQSIVGEGVTVESVQCEDGFAVVAASTPDYDETLRYEAQGGAWVENDDCSDFPPSLQSACNTN